MKKFLGVATAIGFMALSAGAFAAEEASGMIKALNPETRTIVLDDGNTYTVAEGVVIENLKPGSEVKVSYEEMDGKKVIKEVKW